MIRFECPSCDAVLKVQDSEAGRRGLCPKCGQRFQAPESPAVETVETLVVSDPPPAPKPATNVRPIVSLTLGGLSVLGGYVTVEAFGIGFVLTLPLSIVGLVLAIIAWRKQERGPMTIVALVLNPVAIFAGVVLIVLWLVGMYLALRPFHR